MKIRKKILIAFFLLIFGARPSFAAALVPPFFPFGGPILVKKWQVCLVSAPPPVFVVPIPFIFVMVGLPNPARLYYLFGISKLYERKSMERAAESLGIYVIGPEKAKSACLNASVLPDADGTILKIGTSCTPDELLERRDCT